MVISENRVTLLLKYLVNMNKTLFGGKAPQKGIDTFGANYLQVFFNIIPNFKMLETVCTLLTVKVQLVIRWK